MGNLDHCCVTLELGRATDQHMDTCGIRQQSAHYKVRQLEKIELEAKKKKNHLFFPFPI